MIMETSAESDKKLTSGGKVMRFLELARSIVTAAIIPALARTTQ